MRVAVQRGARRRDPLRIGPLREEPRLFGVGAECAGDHQRMTGRARRGMQSVEGRGDIGPHRLALPVGQGTGVATARGDRWRRRRHRGDLERQPRRGARPQFDAAGSVLAGGKRHRLAAFDA